jgi:hypothetical protein
MTIRRLMANDDYIWEIDPVDIYRGYGSFLPRDHLRL